MPRKTARSGRNTTRTVRNVGSHPPLASGVPASSETAYHPRQFKAHLGNPGWFLGPIYGLRGAMELRDEPWGWYMERGLGQIVATGAGEAMTP